MPIPERALGRARLVRRFAFGNLGQERLAAMTKRWIERQAAAFCEVYGKVVHQARTAERSFGDWHLMLSLEAQRSQIGKPAAS